MCGSSLQTLKTKLGGRSSGKKEEDSPAFAGLCRRVAVDSRDPPIVPMVVMMDALDWDVPLSCNIGEKLKHPNRVTATTCVVVSHLPCRQKEVGQGEGVVRIADEVFFLEERLPEVNHLRHELEVHPLEPMLQGNLVDDFGG